MTSDAKEVLDESMHGQESLRLSRRLEPSHLSLSLTRRLVGNLSSVVSVLLGGMDYRWHDLAMSGRVASQLIGNPAAQARGIAPSIACERSDWRLSDHGEAGRGYRSHHHLDPPHTRDIAVRPGS